MKKIAILTIFNNNNNYGGVLQAYSLRKKVDELGYETNVLIYVDGNNPVYPTYRDKIKQYSVRDVLKKGFEMVQAKVFYKKVRSVLETRGKLFDYFRAEYIKTDGPYNDETLVDSQKEYFAYISGSDQIWNPNAVRNGFLLSMIDKYHRKISYAASIGRSTLSKHELEVMIPLISRYDALSVREQTAADILKNNGQLSVQTVLDPTLLLKKEDWEKLCVSHPAEKKYALCYFFSDSKKYRQSINNYCIQNNMELYYIPFANQSFVYGDLKGNGIRQECVGPIEFLSLIKNAECVFTDSFHGTVFSIIFHKKFVVFERDNNHKTASKNSRIYDLLKLTGLEDRLFSGKQIEDYCRGMIDYERVEEKLSYYRNKSIEFLSTALR